MRKIPGLIGAAIGVLGVITQHVAPPWPHHSKDVDQLTAAVRDYLLPAHGPETDFLRQAFASQHRLAAAFGLSGSNTLRTVTDTVTTSDEVTAVIVRGSRP